MIGEGPSARSVRIDLPRFTLLGATTRQGLLTTPLRDRFGIPARLNFYTNQDLEVVGRLAPRQPPPAPHPGPPDRPRGRLRARRGRGGNRRGGQRPGGDPA